MLSNQQKERMCTASKEICDATAISLVQLGDRLMVKYNLDYITTLEAMVAGLFSAAVAAFEASIGNTKQSSDGDDIYREIMGVLNKHRPH